jgi:hypothetical protein
MKYRFYLLTILLAAATVTNAQTGLAPDQNPNYAISRDKYMKMADSLNSWHSTTLQNTYEAIDWRTDKEKAKEERREFRQQLRLERARWSGYDYRNEGYFYPSYNYRPGYYPSSNYYRNNRWHRSHYWWW